MAAELSEKITSCEVSLTPVDNRRLMDLCGRFDEHIRQIEKRLGVEINNRGNSFLILGPKEAVHIAHKIINDLYAQTEKNTEITPNLVHLLIQNYMSNEANPKPHSAQLTELALKTKKGNIQPRSANQSQYVKNIQSNDVIFWNWSRWNGQNLFSGGLCGCGFRSE